MRVGRERGVTMCKGIESDCVCEGTESVCVIEGKVSDCVGLGREVHGSQHTPVRGRGFLWGWVQAWRQSFFGED